VTNKKISALASATTPLVGTELVPIVQGGVTSQTTVAAINKTITGTNAVLDGYGLVNINTSDAAATNKGGSLALGGANGQATSPYVFGVIAGRYEGSSYKGYLQFGVTSDTSGTVSEGFRLGSDLNIKIATAAKGINFTANTPAAGMTSQLLNWYEEGNWTPTFSNCGPSIAITNANYVRIGKQVTARATFTSGVFVANSSVFTLPFASTQLTAGVFVSNTVAGGFIEAQSSTLCYFATSISATVSITITYFTS